MFKTVNQITTVVIEHLGLVQGSAVQTYTEPAIKSAVITMFITMVQKRFWKHLTFNTIHEVDANGIVVDALDTIPFFEDIEWIRYLPYDKYCNFEPLDGAPYLNAMSYRYDRLPWDHVQIDRLVQLYPAAAIGPVMIRARRYATDYLDEDILPFDNIAMEHLVASHLLATDGLNPSAEQRHTMLFDQRYKDLISGEGSNISRYTNRYDNSFTVAEE